MCWSTCWSTLAYSRGLVSALATDAGRSTNEVTQRCLQAAYVGIQRRLPDALGVSQALLSQMHGGVLTCAGRQQVCQLEIEPAHVPGCLLASETLKSCSAVAVCWQRRVHGISSCASVTWLEASACFSALGGSICMLEPQGSQAPWPATVAVTACPFYGVYA